MNWSYAYSPYIWPALISAVLVAALGWYSWRRRNIPGALPFAVAAVFGVLWIIGLILETVATEPSAKIFWFAFQGVWQVPLTTAITCFVLQFGGLGRWLTRRNLILLAVPPLLVLVLILTNGLHHSLWQGFQIGETVKPIRGNLYWISFGYAYALALANIIILIWLFVRSPRYRWPVVIMLVGQLGARIFYALDTMSQGLLEPLSPIFFMFVLTFSTYGLALFRFHVFDPVPLAKAAVLEQMSEGMMVLDLQGRIVDLNPIAGKILGNPTTRLKGRPIGEVMTATPDILAQLDKTAIVQSEITLGAGNAIRYYDLNLTPLVDRSGQVLGQLLLMHDVTEKRQAQARVLEQQRVVATLQERERLARELHDGIGQVLGYVGMQAQTARRWVQDGDTKKAESVLGRLVEVAKDAHTDVRESILSLKAGSAQEWSFVPTLKQYLDNFQANYGIHTELSLSGGMGETTLSPEVEVQLLRVIQEAMTNTRKHSGARAVKVAMELDGKQMHIAVADDGRGFDLGQSHQGAGSHFGLAFMRERLAQIGGSLKIESKPGAGTVVRLDVPTQDRSEESK